ncbi:ABC transporter ATP-binding protein [Cyclobacterium jeungdonense]|uniref:ABC transporter ATP-binding protein n=1 Tax=Cyclobacterium jeungdonense TaxID=708087 RepID=A0ABT8C7L1_9BACT|nr:ABC transporter ATP-binding protein [Cyclobacterium jeungdonense]MDN3688794.1 ABC transporter ATP-binding protein [Cyclobacterium jeungdonense]
MENPENRQSDKEGFVRANDLELGYRSGAKTHRVASGVSFSLFRKELTCLMGPNGVGKSTLLKAIMHQHPPLKGEVWLGNSPASHLSEKERAKRVAVVLTEKIATGLLTVRDLVALGRIPHTGWWGQLNPVDQAKINEVMELTSISQLAHKNVSALSDGQRQTALIARALAQDSPIMVLDEPTAHLDLSNRFEIMYLLRDLARKASKAILVVTHDLEVALETADKLWLMDARQPLLTGSPEDLMISGGIQRLLPGKKWRVDAVTGKIIRNTAPLPCKIEGPEPLVSWVKNALRKNPELNLPDTIFLSENPFSIKATFSQNQHRFDSISEMIRFLQERLKQKISF